MVTEPLLKLSVSLHSNPGVYALLLGSGVSRAAGIPTGWEIVLDLIRKVAKLHNEDPGPEPEQWYNQKFKEPPDYVKLLERLAATPSERNALLRSYFEPRYNEEHEGGPETITVTHKAIASLVKDGCIKVILTTNFDRLLETALEEEGITPDMISTDDALKGAMPLVHSKCTVVKLHGDYRDTRIRNTTGELENYSKEMNTLLDRVLDEYGLIVCGWSGEWDVALRSAILRCPSRRFTTYWAYKGELNDYAKQLIRHRKAETLFIESADKFFSEVLEKVKALHELEHPYPLSTPVAVATVKRYLAEDKYRIPLRDLLFDEMNKLYTELSSKQFDFHDRTGKTPEGFQKRMRQYELFSETLVSISVAMSYYDEKERYTQYLTKCIERIIQPPVQKLTFLLHLHFYPALLLCYASGIAALAAGHYKYFAAVLLRPEYYYHDKKLPAVDALHAINVFRDGTDKWVSRPEAEGEYTPANNHISDILREPLRGYIPDDKKYEGLFDIYEYLLGLTYVDLIYGESVTREKGIEEILYDKSEAQEVWGPVGCFKWRYRRDRVTPMDEFVNSGLSQEGEWGLLKAGFFSGSVKRFNSICIKYNDFLSKINWR